MIHDPAILDVLEDLPDLAWEGSVWRHMFNDYQPDRVNTAGARWNPPSIGAVYTAYDRDTALAEGQHAIDSQPRRTFAKRVLYEVHVEVNALVDLTAPGALQAVGLNESDIEADDFSRCQAVGGAAAWLERDGLIVPSARADGSNLVILVGTRGAPEMTILRTEIVT